jgi:hypothetical protein
MVTEMERKLYCTKCGAENLNWKSRCEKCGEELHKGERQITEFEKRGGGFWFAFLLGMMGFVFLIGISIFAIALSSGDIPVSLVASILVPAAGLVISFKWQKIAGILLGIGGILPVLMIWADSGFTADALVGNMFLILSISVPLLASGAMFFLRGRE